MTQAMIKIATCYNPTHTPGLGRLIEIRQDLTKAHANRAGRFVVAEIKNGICDHSSRHRTEDAAIAHASSLGYTEIVQAPSKSFSKAKGGAP